jgi:hypothetical protein
VKFLITGVAGFKGSSLVQRLAEVGEKVMQYFVAIIYLATFQFSEFSLQDGRITHQESTTSRQLMPATGFLSQNKSFHETG